MLHRLELTLEAILDRGTPRLTLGAFWVVPGHAFEWLWAQARASGKLWVPIRRSSGQNYIDKHPIHRHSGRYSRIERQKLIRRHFAKSILEAEET